MRVGYQITKSLAVSSLCSTLRERRWAGREWLSAFASAHVAPGFQKFLANAGVYFCAQNFGKWFFASLIVAVCDWALSVDPLRIENLARFCRLEVIEAARIFSAWHVSHPAFISGSDSTLFRQCLFSTCFPCVLGRELGCKMGAKLRSSGRKSRDAR